VTFASPPPSHMPSPSATLNRSSSTTSRALIMQQLKQPLLSGGAVATVQK